MPKVLSPLLVEDPAPSNVVVTILPSGDTSGATDTVAINAVLSAGGSVQLAWTGTNWSGAETPYYIDAPLTPATGASLRGAMPWMASDSDNYGSSGGVSGGSVIYVVSSFSGSAAISMSNATGSQYYGVSLQNFSLECSVQPSGYGILVDGAWGACFMSGVCVNSPYSDCLHFQTDSTTSKVPDDWNISNCKFSGSQHGYGVYAANLPDSWITDCESSENHLDNWWIGFSTNTSMTRCKGENSATGAGIHLTGQGGTGRALSLTGCSTHLNYEDGFLFDNGSSGTDGGVYLLSNCFAISDNQAAGTTYSGYRATGSVNVVVASNCYAYGAYYGASQVSSSQGMTFTGSNLSGTSAAVHDDGSNATHLVNQATSGPSTSSPFNVLTFGADPTGTNSSATAIQNAVNAAVTAGGGVVYIPAGTYKVSTTITKNVSGTAVYIVGDGVWATTLKYYGSGDCLRLYDSSTYSSRTVYGGGVIGLTIDGANASGSALSTGIHVGDILKLRLDIGVQNFTYTGSMGVHFDNQYYWTEQALVNLWVSNCVTHVVFDVASGAATTATGSYDRCLLDIIVNQSTDTYNGVVFQNGTYINDGKLAIRGNFVTNTTAPSSAVLTLTGEATGSRTDTGTYSSLLGCQLDIGVECDIVTGTKGAHTLSYGSVNNFIYGCYGTMDFAAAGSNFQTSENVTTGTNFTYSGPIDGDNTLAGNYVGNLTTSYITVYGAGGNPIFIAGDSSGNLTIADNSGAPAYPAFLSGAVFTGAISPSVTALTDGSAVSVNAALGNVFTWSLGGASHTLGVPSNPVNGQQIVIDIAYTGSYTPLFNAVFAFGTDGQPTWTATSGKTDSIAFRYSSLKSEWLCMGWKLGY